MKTFTTTIALVLIVATCAFAFDAAVMPPQWSQAGHDAQRSHNVPETGKIPLYVYPYSRFEGKEADLSRETDLDQTQPVVDGKGILYYTSTKGQNLTSFHPDTKQPGWNNDVTKALNGSFLRSELALTTTATNTFIIVFVGATSAGQLAAFDATNGRPVAVTSAVPCASGGSVQFVGNPVVHSSGLILASGICGANATLQTFKFSGTGFTLGWNYSYNAAADPTVVASPGATGLIYVALPPRGIRALNATDGTPKWSWNYTQAAFGSIALNAVTPAGNVLALWSNGTNTDSLEVATVVINAENGTPPGLLINNVRALAVGPTGVIYARYYNASSKHFNIVSVNETTGDNIWTWPTKPQKKHHKEIKLPLDASFRITVDAEEVLYVYVAQKGHQQLYGLNATGGGQLPGWPRDLYKRDHDKKPQNAYVPVVSVPTGQNASYVFVTKAVYQGKDKPVRLTYDLLGCCSGHGHCSTSGCKPCDENYYGDACQTYCKAETTCHGNGKCNDTGHCKCDKTEFWDLKTYSGEDCSEIVNLTIFGGVVIIILFILIAIFSLYVILRSRRPTVTDYAALSTVMPEDDPYQ